jgi:hypothetical protein
VTQSDITLGTAVLDALGVRLLYRVDVSTTSKPANPLQAWTRPEGSRRLRLPEFLKNLHTKVVRLSAPRTGRLYHPGNIPSTHFC